MNGKRFAQVVRLKPGAYDEYVRLHNEAWPDLLQAMNDAHIHNFSIFHHEGMLFAVYDYTGDNFEGDMARLADAPRSREWAAMTNSLQISLDGQTSDDPDADLWTPLELLFHLD